MSLMILPRVYVDESNSTGENLLDPSQPVFSIAAVSVQDDLATALVDNVTSQLPKGHGEPKYTALAKTGHGRAALLECYKKIPRDGARFYVAHKRFMVEAKMVDLLIEPRAHKDGYNIYEDGAAVALANLIDIAGPVLGEKLAYDKMLSTFVKAVRGNSQATVDDLFATIDNYCQTATPKWRETIDLFMYMRDEAEELIEDVARGRLRDELDPAIPCLAALVWDVGQRIGQFVLIHDTSKVVAKHALTLLNTNKLLDPTRPGRFMSPLPAVTIEFSDSKEVPQLQLADWIAGAGRQWATELVWKKGDRFAADLTLIVKEWFIGGLWPDPSTIEHPSPRISPNPDPRHGAPYS
jgi:Protein of unknown function (DUF3800)